ncbi:MAG: HI1506-related protein, partial [Syntrophobacteraceae bacterium]|nr:hypothetical protein [Desulfobacteraceae bacterium]
KQEVHMIRINSRKDGFRRCGVSHAAGWVEYPSDRFTHEEIERLRAEPTLQVEIAPAGEKKQGKGKE